MRSCFLGLVACGIAACASLPGATRAAAAVQVSIDLSRQRMHVDSARGSYDWPISTARSGFSTPGGSYAPTHLERMHYSRKYDMSPMPHAIFFRGGYAIHGTHAIGSLGRPASHGCVRLAPGNAAALYGMVQAEGARISISGTPPTSRPFARRTHAARRATTHNRIDRSGDIDVAAYARSYRRLRTAHRAYREYGWDDSGYAPYGYRPFYTHPAYLYAPSGFSDYE